MRSLAQSHRQSRAPTSSARAQPGPAGRGIGNQAALRMLQAKLAIGTPGDAYEQQADRIADQVMRAPQAQVQRACADCDEAVPARLQTKAAAPSAPAPAEATPLVEAVLSEPGQQLDATARAFMEPRFGYDFSQVRVHTGERAAQSARDVSAIAYTVGNHVVFAAGQHDPGTAAGGRLLAHELTHVIQQNATSRPSVQREEPKAAPKDKDPPAAQPVPATPAKADPATALYHIVVRDKELDLGGGVLVADLAAAKVKMMARKVDTPWTLVLAIHASENRLGAQSGPDWQKNAIFYDDADVKKLFGGDPAFVAWRDQYGPNRVVLYGCQVTAAFEQTIADNLARGGKAPTASGLGEGCKPLANSVTFGVNTRREYDKLADDEKTKMLGEVQAANKTWGYYGGPPVPNDEVLDYLFKGPNPGHWSEVEVIVKQGDDYVSTKPPTPYWNRASNSTFLQQCTKAVGNLREHTPTAPK